MSSPRGQRILREAYAMIRDVYGDVPMPLSLLIEAAEGRVSLRLISGAGEDLALEADPAAPVKQAELSPLEAEIAGTMATIDFPVTVQQVSQKMKLPTCTHSFREAFDRLLEREPPLIRKVGKGFVHVSKWKPRTH